MGEFNEQRRKILMESTKLNPEEVNQEIEDVNSLKGTLFSSIVFVGGGILLFIIVLFVFYMMRV